MNIVEGLDYLKAALVVAGIPANRITVGMDLNSGSSPGSDSPPAASVYARTTLLHRQVRKYRVPVSDLVNPPERAVGGMRSSVMVGHTRYEVLIDQRGLGDMQNTLALFFARIGSTDVVDAQGNTYGVLTDGDPAEREVQVKWNDTARDRVAVSFELLIPTVIWQDSPLLPIQIVLQYRLARSLDDIEDAGT